MSKKNYKSSEIYLKRMLEHIQKIHPTKKYYPHITVGFIGGDVHNVSKSVDTCVAEVELY